MKRLAVLALLGTGCLLVGVVPGVTQKKSAKPIIETFEATNAISCGVLRFEIEEFSTDQDIQELAQAYAKGGEDAVESALGKMEMGHFWVRNEAYPIRVVRSASEGGVRTLIIVAVAADRVVGPFTFIYLQIDQQGKGRGQEFPFATVLFDKEGGIDVKNMGGGSGATPDEIPLVNVHAVSQTRRLHSSRISGPPCYVK
jgi:hypothetical protein